MIEVRGLTKRYGDKLAVDDLSFTVQPGRVTGFLASPTRVAKGQPRRRRRVGLVLGCTSRSSGTWGGPVAARCQHPTAAARPRDRTKR